MLIFRNLHQRFSLVQPYHIIIDGYSRSKPISVPDVSSGLFA